MKKIAILYHSGYGHTEFVANNIKAGIEAAGATCTLMKAADVNAKPERLDELLSYDMIVFGSPTYMGNMAAELKKTLEFASKVWMPQAWKDKFAAGFTVGGGLSGDKSNTLTGLLTFAMQQSMIWVSLGLLADGKDAESMNRMGSYTGLMAQYDNVPPEQSAPGDVKTSRLFGERLAKFLNDKVK